MRTKQQIAPHAEAYRGESRTRENEGLCHLCGTYTDAMLSDI